MLEPGNYVKWKFPHTKYQVSRIVERQNGHLIVAANGNTYEIDPVTDVASYLAACARCGKPTKRSGKVHCSVECYLASRLDVSTEKVFEAIVDYKRANDGLSPAIRAICDSTALAPITVLNALERLVEAGKIRMAGVKWYRRIIVAGGKWTYEP